MQILTAEHWGLLASRSLAWTESFSRADAFLTAVSGAVVALALVGQSTGHGRAFVTFALILLPVVLFLGLTTVIRLNQVNDLDLIYLQAMNRLRRAYLDLVPGVAPYFSMASHDDLASSLFSGFAVRRKPMSLMQGFMINPALISVICSVVSGVIAGAIIASPLTGGVQGSIVAGVAGVPVLSLRVIRLKRVGLAGLGAPAVRSDPGHARLVMRRRSGPSRDSLAGWRGGRHRTSTPATFAAVTRTP